MYLAQEFSRPSTSVSSQASQTAAAQPQFGEQELALLVEALLLPNIIRLVTCASCICTCGFIQQVWVGNPKDLACTTQHTTNNNNNKHNTQHKNNINTTNSRHTTAGSGGACQGYGPRRAAKAEDQAEAFQGRLCRGPVFAAQADVCSRLHCVRQPCGDAGSVHQVWSELSCTFCLPLWQDGSE